MSTVKEKAKQICIDMAEEIKHTSHRDGLGMGDQRSEQVCLILSERISAIEDEQDESKAHN